MCPRGHSEEIVRYGDMYDWTEYITVDSRGFILNDEGPSQLQRWFASFRESYKEDGMSNLKDRCPNGGEYGVRGFCEDPVAP